DRRGRVARDAASPARRPAGRARRSPPTGHALGRRAPCARRGRDRPRARRGVRAACAAVRRRVRRSGRRRLRERRACRPRRRRPPALARALGPRAVVGVVAFGGPARVLAPPSHEPPSAAALVAAADAAGLDPDASDLAGALALAAPLCPETTQPAVLLFSDGQETRGSALAEASLQEPHLPGFPVSLA